MIQILMRNVGSTDSPSVTMLFKQTMSVTKAAPVFASYSSRGPSPIISKILKLDIITPGSLVMAAWTPNLPIVQHDAFYSNFNMMSGASVARARLLL